MVNHARIDTGHVVIDALAWLEQRTAGRLPHLTDDLNAWGSHTRQTVAALYHWADLVPLWLTVRGFTSPEPADPGAAGVVAHIGTRLDADLWIARARTPHDGPIAVVLHDEDPPVVYTDVVHDSADWYDADTVDIVCPNGHGWTWRTGRELLTADGSFTTLAAVFGTDLDAPFQPCGHCEEYRLGRRPTPCRCDRTSWILCPICRSRCDVELPPR